MLRIREFAVSWAIALVLAGLLILLFVDPAWVTENVRHIIQMLTAVILVHLLDRTILKGEMTSLVGRILDNVRAGIAAIIGDLRKETRDNLDQAVLRIESNTNEILSRKFHILEVAAQTGLKDLYACREAAMPDIIDAIRGAKERIWILGVAFSHTLRFDELPATFHEKLGKEKFDLRILLLDALRSPAVFRSFLESDPEHVRQMVELDRSKPPRDEPYTRQILFGDFHNTLRAIRNYPDIELRVRYYAHSPSFWMLVVDRTVYIEPYTFGRPKGFSESRIGGMMPVMKFENVKGQDAYEILTDHYDKLWRTSDIDSFQVAARVHDSAAVLRRIFDRGSAWFRHVYYELYVVPQWKAADRRTREYARYRVPRAHAAEVEIQWGAWETQGPEESGTVSVVDCSRGGVGLRIDSANLPKRDDRIWIDGRQIRSREVRYMVEELGCRNGRPCPLKVVWVDPRTKRLGARAVGDAGA